MALKSKKKMAGKAARKKRATKAKAAAAGAPKFLTLKKFKVLAEATRRQRISAARTTAPQATTASAIDLSQGFDPTEDD